MNKREWLRSGLIIFVLILLATLVAQGRRKCEMPGSTWIPCIFGNPAKNSFEFPAKWATGLQSSWRAADRSRRPNVVALFWNLFLAVLLSVSLRCLFSMGSHMNRVAPRSVSVVGRLFVMSSLMMLCCFGMMTGNMRSMFRRLFVVLGCFFWHSFSPFVWPNPRGELPTTTTGAQSTEDRALAAITGEMQKKLQAVLEKAGVELPTASGQGWGWEVVLVYNEIALVRRYSALVSGE
jgi:hypothetical protein